MLIAIDFDGTCVENEFPQIGEPLPHALEVLKALIDAGHELILWTCREDHSGNPKEHHLSNAVKWFDDQGIRLSGINKTPDSREFRKDCGPIRKAFASVYIDDRNLGGFPGWDIVHEKILGEVYAGNGSA